MSHALSAILPYLPPTLVRAALTQGIPLNEIAATDIPAAILFADVSGFTPLTELLARRGAEGPEELTYVLNTYFSAMIDALEDEGGEVVKFSGDALTVLFPAIDEPLGYAVRRALQAATQMQHLMTAFSTVTTSAGPVHLAMKIGIGAGTVRTFQVGGMFGRWEYLVAGDPLRQVTAAENNAAPGQVVCSPETAALDLPAALPPRAVQLPANHKAEGTHLFPALIGYIPASIRAWLEEGLSEWIAVLRPITVLFLGIGGLDYNAPAALTNIQACMSALQVAAYRHEGSINKLVVDDKGTVLMVLFGVPPFAHSDDPARAVACALDFQQVATTQGLRMAVGIATGHVFAGPVGSRTRREYTVMGGTVNLAARLMSAAGARQIRCERATFLAARRIFDFEVLPLIKVKGIADLIPVYRPTGQPATPLDAGITIPLIGREPETARLAQALESFQAQQQGHVFILEGETGMGKSRLIAEFRRMVQATNTQWLYRAGLHNTQTPYQAWLPIIMACLPQSPDQAPSTETIEQRMAHVAPHRSDLLPLLNDVLGLDLPENATLAPLQSNERHDLRMSLLVELIRLRALQAPLVIVLEDAQWFDSLSWELTQAVGRAINAGRLPLLLLLSIRLTEQPPSLEALESLVQLPSAERIRLHPLSADATLDLAANCLGQPPAIMPANLATLLRNRVGGNPFFAEELVLSLRDQGMLRVIMGTERPYCELADDNDQLLRSIPPTLHGLVLARIDRLPPEQQLTLKLGAVIGYQFAYAPLYRLLNQTRAASHEEATIWLAQLAEREFLRSVAPPPNAIYEFQHAIIRDVTYNTLLFSQRRQLHRAVAEWYEQFVPDTGDKESDQVRPVARWNILAYHWEQVGELQRAINALQQAGTQALKLYALAEARQALSHALALLASLPNATQPNSAVEAPLRHQLGIVCWYSGDLAVAYTHFAQSLALAPSNDDEPLVVENLSYLGRIASDIGDYHAARAHLEAAYMRAAANNDRRHQMQIRRYLGVVAQREGDYREAEEESNTALSFAQQSADDFAIANILLDLGANAVLENRLADARRAFSESLEVCRQLGHRWIEAIAVSNLGELAAQAGDIVTAQTYQQEGLQLARSFGDRFGVAINLNNLGELAWQQGNHADAVRYFREGLPAMLEVGSSIALLYGLYGLLPLLAHLDDPMLAASLAELIIQHPACDVHLQQKTRQFLDKIATTLRPTDRCAAREHGAHLSLEQAVQSVLLRLPAQ